MFFRNAAVRRRCAIAFALVMPLTAGALLPPWLQHVRNGDAFESALYRAMDLPGVRVFFPRPPKESVAELNKMPETPALYALRARQEEAALDFSAAEADWKQFAAKAPEPLPALEQLADFYHRRLAVQPELATLLQIGSTAASPVESYVVPAQQRAWVAFERAKTLAADQGLDDATTLRVYAAWAARYPQQPVVYGRAINWMVQHQLFSEANTMLASYRSAFPDDRIFPVKAAALIALRRGGPDAQSQAIAVYDAAFEPLWPAPLADSYFSLLEATHGLRHFLADANGRLAHNPDDLNAAGRLFLYQQHQQNADAAAAVLEQYRRSKESRKAAWGTTELFTLAQLSLAAHDAPSAARYDFALYGSGGNTPNGEAAHVVGLTNMVALLLSTPSQPMTLGAGNLSMYRDIATLDRGPGLWNGVLSLWFNGQSPSNEFAQEEQKAQPYFQRAKAAELLALLDREAPTAPQRPALHAQLLQAYAAYGDDQAVIREGNTLLQQFPAADTSFRLAVALSMADAYARRGDAAAEYALYDRSLGELAARAKNMPLTSAALGHPVAPAASDDAPAPAKPDAAKAFELDTGAPTAAVEPDAVAYTQVLDRYLGRLTSAKKLPEALAVLRKELDRNANDPALYEKLAEFLGQNNLSAQQEEVYRRAIDKFQDAGWTDKLARFYLRSKRNQDFAALTRKVVDTFDGTEVDSYFARNAGGGQALFLQLNLYAHQRFPHDDVFTENLLTAYTTKATTDRAAWEKLLRETWWQTPQRTQRFFEYLSSTGTLDAELASLAPPDANPAATREAAEAELWRSHHEASAPLFDKLAREYPADLQLGTTATDLERSLAWFDGAHTQTAVTLEEQLLRAHPGDTARLARIGDILADRADDSAASLAASADYWRRIPLAAPGRSENYLEAATVFWDYFQFDDALAQIQTARVRFHEPALYGYEAGAIAEGKRDYPLAVKEYVAAALANNENAHDRLLRLARRPDTRPLVDAATSSAAATPEGLSLRLSVLAATHRNGEVPNLLKAALQSARDASAAANIAELARARSLHDVHEAALAREAELTSDAVDKLELQYQLATAYEQNHAVAYAARVIDAVYHDNSMLLGVVRTTVDFDSRNQRQPQAIQVLVAAANAARPGLRQQLLAEAAGKANEAGDTREARTLTDTLLSEEPYNALYLSLAADSYLRAGDDAGLERFYTDRLNAVRSAPMDETLRRERVAQLRKGLIPALTRAKQYDAATDQYIALISAYPEDATLTNEAALYALRYGRRQQLLDFYVTTTKASPRDSRFLIDLAQTQSVFADLPAAIDAYARAIAIRNDRVDLRSAKAALEETLQRFDEAVADYQRLYVLSYKDRSWMIAIAQVRARQGRAADASVALKTAYLTGPTHSAHDYFQIASQLEQWGFLPEAAAVAADGRKAAGDAFLSAEDPGPDDAAFYARLLVRLRRAPEALATLKTALAAASLSSSSPTLIAAQVKAEGLASVTDGEWRTQQAAARKQRAAEAFARAVTAAGAAVQTYYTPEEKASYAGLLDQQRVGATSKQLAEVWVPAAHAAGLLEMEAAWRRELLVSPGALAQSQLEPYTTLQQARLRFAELGTAVEAFLRLHPKSADQATQVAANAFHDAGDAAGEARVLRAASLREENGVLRTRYLNLLAKRDTGALVALAANRDDALADAAANTAMSRGTPALALAAVRARGKAISPVWTSAMVGAAHLYLGDNFAEGDASLREALLPEATIAERLAAKPDLTHTLTGELWYYYAARNAQLRLAAASAHDGAEDLIAADLEYSATAEDYSALAQTYAEAGDVPAALAELEHVLELDPHAADAQDDRAVILWKAGRTQEAVASWSAALASLRFIEDRSAAPELFWTEFVRIARRVREHNLYSQLKAPMDDVLRVYLARNGDYRSNELLRAAVASAPTATEGAAWAISLASVAVDPGAVLYDLTENDRAVPIAVRVLLLQEQIRLAQRTLSSDTTAADSNSPAAQRALSAQTTLLELYVEQKKNAEALALLRSIDPAQRASAGLQQDEIVLAARTGQLDALLTTWRVQPDAAPAADVVQRAAAQLSAESAEAAARTLLEFSLDRSLAAHTAASTDYLSLAESRLNTNDLRGALDLLHALVQQPGLDTYASLDAAAALLESNGHSAEAADFLTTLAHNVPWDLSYTVRLAEAQKQEPASLAALVSVARNPLAPYSLRVRAANDLAGTQTAALGSDELQLIATGKVSPEAARRPYFAAARLLAADHSADARVRAMLLREAVAMAPAAPTTMLQIFRADVHAGNMTEAAAVQQVLMNARTTAPDDGSETAGMNAETNNVALPAGAEALPTAERAQVAFELATSSQAAADIAGAVSYYRLAARLDAKLGSKAQPAIQALQTAQRLAAANATRRPVIRRELAQANVVRAKWVKLSDEPAGNMPEEE